jgi:drug/metabolite transporter (DMT)-like permease
MNLIALVLMLAATLCWGADQTIGKLAVKRMSVSVFNALRPTFVAPLAIIFALSTNSLSYPGAFLTAIAILAGVISWCVGCELYFYLLKRGTVHKILPIGNSHPVWGVFAAILFLGEEATLFIFVSAALVIIGAYFLAQKEQETGRWKRMVPLALLVAIMWGVVIVLNKFCLNEGVKVGTLLTIEVISAAVACNIVMGIHQIRAGIKLDKKGVGLSFLSGFSGFFIGHVLYLSALGIEKASVLAPINGAVIPFGFLLSILLVRERPSKKAILGMVIVFIGVFLATI